MPATHPAIIDGHNDVLLKLYRAGGLAQAGTFLSGRDGALDLPKARAGGFGGGFFAVYVPSPMDREARDAEMTNASYDLPLPEPIDWEDALPVVLSQAAILFELERQGALSVCRSVAEMRAALAAGRIAAIFHIEGAEGIDPDLHMLDVLHAAGLRSLGPVWSRNTIFGHGVPFRFPSGPDIGPGLTDHGIRLVRRCNQLGILIDLSHMNAAGFWDVARHSDKPLVATHSNAHAIRTLCAAAHNVRNREDAIMRRNAAPSLLFGEFRATSFTLFLLGSGSEGIEPGKQVRVTFPSCWSISRCRNPNLFERPSLGFEIGLGIVVGRVEADMPEPASDDGDIDARRDKVDSRRVPEAVWRHMLRAKRGCRIRRRRDVTRQLVPHARCPQGFAVTIGEDALIRRARLAFQQSF